MGTEDRVRDLVAPIVANCGLELYDIELASGILRVTVDRKGGVDVDGIGEVSQLISHALDEEDAVSDARYLLEVSSPGIERRLRLPRHFQDNVGEQVRVRLRKAVEGIRRFDGALTAATDDVATIEVEGEPRNFEYADIEDARTVFDWSQALSAKGRADAEVDDIEEEIEDRSDTSSNKKASAQ